jgi:hypothetical protein
MFPKSSNPASGYGGAAKHLERDCSPPNSPKTPATQARSKLTVRAVEFKPLVKNTLRGFASAHIAEMRITFNDIPVHAKNGRRWAQLPAKAFVKDGELVKNATTGKINYLPMFVWDSHAVADAFSNAVVRAVLEACPGRF